MKAPEDRRSVLRNLSIRSKLIGVILVVTTVCIVWGFTLATVKTIDVLSDSLSESVAMTAQAMAGYMALYVSLDDPEAIESDFDRLLQDIPSVTDAHIYRVDKADAPFASYGRGPTPFLPPRPVYETRTELSGDGSIHSYTSIYEPGKGAAGDVDEPVLLGTLFVRADTEAYDRQRRETMIYMFAVLLTATVASVCLAWPMQALVSGPILKLAAVAGQISRDADYSVRMPAYGRDEVGILYQGFNDMLDEIERYQKNLKGEIAERKHAEAMLRTQAAELMLRNAELEKLAFTVSYDLRSPLVTIRGFLGLLSNDIESGDRETLQRNLDYIASAVNVIEERHADLLHLSRRGQLFSKLMQAQSPAHLAALRDEIREIEATAPGGGDDAPALDRSFMTALRHVVDGIEPLERLPDREDRAHILAEALTHALAMKDTLKAGSKEDLDRIALDSIRQIFTNALQDIAISADIRLRLLSRQVTARREAVVVLEIHNVGKGHAENVDVKLNADDRILTVRQPEQHLESLLAGQKARLEFLVEPICSERVRLAFQAAYDDRERKGKHLEFADVMDLRRIPESQTFRLLRPNPYVVGRPLVASDPFFGRNELFKELAANFQGAVQDNVVILIGQRRMGKTSILRRLDKVIPANYVPVIVDLQGLLATGEASFFREVALQIVDELEERGLIVPEPSEEAFQQEAGRTFRHFFLRRIQEALDGQRLLVVFDEMEVLEERIVSGDLPPRVLPYLRSLIQHEGNISFMLAGTHRLDELTADYWGVLFNLAIYLEVGHLSPADVEDLLVKPTRGHFEIDSLAVEKVYRTTGGHPHFSQLVARELVDYCNQEQLSYVTVQDVNQVVEVVIDKSQLHIAYLWEEASEDERRILLAVKDLYERDGIASREAIRRQLQQHGAGPGRFFSAVNNLYRKEVLVEEAGQLRFRIDLLRRWLSHQNFESSTIMKETS